MMKPRTVLLIEDEPDIVEVIEYNLKRSGFSVLIARDGEHGLETARRDLPDLILLDLMLPGRDGIEICRRLKSERATGAIPIVMVTAKGEEEDIVLGLGIGADDYITKPFGVKELLARVQAVIRRGPLSDDERARERVVRGPLVVDKGRHEVIVNEKRISFTATELRLLHFLASHPGRVFTRDQILNRVVGEDAVVIDRNIDVHIRSIRKKLEECAEMIETIRGGGYRFREEDY